MQQAVMTFSSCLAFPGVFYKIDIRFCPQHVRSISFGPRASGMPCALFAIGSTGDLNLLQAVAGIRRLAYPRTWRPASDTPANEGCIILVTIVLVFVSLFGTPGTVFSRGIALPNYRVCQVQEGGGSRLVQPAQILINIFLSWCNRKHLSSYPVPPFLVFRFRYCEGWIVEYSLVTICQIPMI